MENHSHHEELIAGLKKQYAEILTNSKQGVYIYLDDTHKLCNSNFAKMLGYKTAAEWENSNVEFAANFVDEYSSHALVHAYMDAMKSNIGSTIDINWKNKAGKIVPTRVILVPIPFGAHIFALHYVSLVK